MNRLIKSTLLSLCAIVLCLTVTAADSLAAKSKKKESPPEVVIHISPEVIDSLKKSNIDGTIRYLRIEATSPRSKYLLRESQRIAGFNRTDKKLTKSNYKLLYNIGVAYHNLYLFLKVRGIENRDFFKDAERFYFKASKTKSPSKKNQIRVILAALYYSSGNTKKAEKMFGKADLELIDDVFKKNETLALYYSSKGDVESALEALERAYKINPELIRFWMGISDDYYEISSDQRYKELFKKWNVKILNRGPTSYSSKKERVVN